MDNLGVAILSQEATSPTVSAQPAQVALSHQNCLGVRLAVGVGLPRTSDTARCVGAEMGANLTAVDLGSGRTAISIAAGGDHVCVILVRP